MSYADLNKLRDTSNKRSLEDEVYWWAVPSTSLRTSPGVPDRHRGKLLPSVVYKAKHPPCGEYFALVGRPGVEPGTRGLKGPCSTN